MRIDVTRQSPISASSRARQLEALFDVPRREASVVEWHGEIDLEAHDWSVGLIVGPSGSGKSTLAGELFELRDPLEWGAASVIDDFDSKLSMDDVSAVCQAVGFNTIPSWLRPYGVLSTGEQFRVSLARQLVETQPGDTIVVDEFTSVVDRQVAKIGAHAVQKWARRNDRRFVAVSCHYDVIDWLQPDWVFEPATMTLEWRSVQPRPQLDVAVSATSYAAWQLFAPFHYLTAELNRTARCFMLFVDDRPAAFAGLLYRPHPKTNNIMGISRLVTLPDWQGLGLAFVLCDTIGAAYKSMGWRVRMYPAHPALIRAYDRSPRWVLSLKPGSYNVAGKSSGMAASGWRNGNRPNATFEYVGPSADFDASSLLDCVELRKSKSGSLATATTRSKRRRTAF